MQTSLVPLRNWFAQHDRRTLPEGVRPACVLVALWPGANGWQVVFTRRSERLNTHPGEISFPGGRIEPGELRPEDTALREAEEELGLAAAHVDVIGCLDDVSTLKAVRITPVVAVIPAAYPFAIQHDEVAEVFSVPWRTFLDPAQRQETWWSRDAGTPARQIIFYQAGPHLIWGATARIIDTWVSALTAQGRQGAEVLQMLSGG
ncbi:MAG: CoA pyrophosphatase [Candidatus Sericytochromatia bacterium]|nr:CoA pyrophosphatase [Candidatus Sericytochromatia bacterium]